MGRQEGVSLQDNFKTNKTLDGFLQKAVGALDKEIELVERRLSISTSPASPVSTPLSPPLFQTFSQPLYLQQPQGSHPALTPPPPAVHLKNAREITSATSDKAIISDSAQLTPDLSAKAFVLDPEPNPKGKRKRGGANLRNKRASTTSTNNPGLEAGNDRSTILQESAVGHLLLERIMEHIREEFIKRLHPIEIRLQAIEEKLGGLIKPHAPDIPQRADTQSHCHSLTLGHFSGTNDRTPVNLAAGPLSFKDRCDYSYQPEMGRNARPHINSG
ncbi:hypothetical protein NDU88_005068 [Pleurodeles waltl]|uniref:Uncharacterized protein n=1 Tax=Pleurodeles waltl TaxID=8319 RepID=A0AAV7SKM7_PLEWA|nr:hypothetical protein NDU88_005068 [Pleurodeles waltl]